MSLIARHLEANGIATVIMGCARDIVEHVGVPRLLYSEFPLGNSAGRPNDPDSQQLTLQLALELLDDADAPGTTRTSPLTWPGSDDWQQDFMNVDRLAPEKIAKLKADFAEQKRIASQLKNRC